MTNPVSFKAKSGSDASGVSAEPSGDGKAPAVVIIQENWGLDAHVKDLVDRFAKAGYVVVAPDLYHGKLAKDAEEAGKLAGELDTLKAVDEIAGAMAYLRTHPRSNGKVGVVGFCLGGALALATACNAPDIDAVVSFYGLPPAEKADYSKVEAPVQMHIAKRDQWVTVDRASHVRGEIEKTGKHVDLHIYAANHAFFNDTREDVYSPKDAEVAWENTTEFLQKYLG